jgi:hypothetical protein
MLLGRQQGAVSRSANLAAESAEAYLEGSLVPLTALAGGICFYGIEGVVLAVLLGRPFFDSGRP